MRLAAAALLLLSCCACGSPRPAGVLLITLDTTRPDHLGCYGYAAAATPNLDALAKESVRFDQAMAAVPTTLASHATMFTGLYPPRHGVRYNGMFRLGDESVTVAELFHAASFATAAVPSAYPVAASTGIGQGFDAYHDMFAEKGANPKPTASRPAAEVTKLGIEALDGLGKGKFFVWLHYYDAHYPYEPAFPFSASFREHPYDGEIAAIDKQLGVLFEALKKQGLWDKMAIIVAGDHGEGLYEHGERMHSELVYQSTLRVPLLIKAPGARRGSLVKEPVTLADLAPTMLDLAGLAVPSGLDGISLVPSLRGGALPTRSLYFETLAGSLAFGWGPLDGVRRGKWKLIRGSSRELYDLDTDPHELNDTVSSEASIAADLGATLDHDLAAWKGTPTPASTHEVPADPEALARLASLGYAGGAMTAVRPDAPNPKDLVHLESELLLIQDFMTERQFARAMLAIPNVLKDDPGNRLALQSAADASAGLRKLDDAERYASEVVRRYPEYLPGLVTLGRLQVAKKDYKRAEEIFRDGLTRFPDEPVVVYSLAMTLVAENRAAEAAPIVDRALTRPHPDPGFHVLQALCRATAGDYATAKTALQQAVEGGYARTDTLRFEPLMAPLKKIPGFDEVLATKPKKAS